MYILYFYTYIYIYIYNIDIDIKILTIIKHLQNIMRQANFAHICLHKFVFPAPPTL